MTRLVIHLVCGARPNFMKVAPLYHRLTQERWAMPMVIHTGQHYDPNMSDAFFEDLRLPKPDVYLGVGSGTHAEQTAKVMVEYEQVLLRMPPALVIVVGDVNSSMAATLAASKLRIEVAHLEAGLRSFDRRMPEEVNRVVTDVLADILWTPSRDANENLAREGVPESKIEFVGNIMIDSLEMLREKIETQVARLDFGFAARSYGVVTLHRPSNVDDVHMLARAVEVLLDLSKTLPLVFPVHPRTREKLQEQRLLPQLEQSGRVFLPPPLSYIRFMSLVFDSRLVITDSGGIQEETSYLGIPCLTVRENTERPTTVIHGTNRLCGLETLKQSLRQLGDVRPQVRAIEYWDGCTAERIVRSLRRRYLAEPKHTEPFCRSDA